MLKMTPEAYIQVRMMNGSNWLTSSKLDPQRARMKEHPTLNRVWKTSTRGVSSQYQVSGRQPRGNGSALISGRFSRITVEEVMQERWMKLNTKMPVTRNGT